mmetsp:Transcript_114818/g.320890  ORF Transcript_114818/g.320890 Transcript_114818/m.320890 type:complete len:128 (+) Transcript_114818:77-460(+)
MVADGDGMSSAVSGLSEESIELKMTDMPDDGHLYEGEPDATVAGDASRNEEFVVGVFRFASEESAVSTALPGDDASVDLDAEEDGPPMGRMCDDGHDMLSPVVLAARQARQRERVEAFLTVAAGAQR